MELEQESRKLHHLAQPVVDAVDMCHWAGVTPFGSFILGLPGETPETIKETVNFGKQLKDMGLSYGFHLLAPFPGTEIREQSAAFDIKIQPTIGPNIMPTGPS